jgi:hypothetical protein
MLYRQTEGADLESGILISVYGSKMEGRMTIGQWGGVAPPPKEMR